MTAPDYVPPGFIHSKSDAWAEYAWQRLHGWGWFTAGLKRGVVPSKREYKRMVNQIAAHLYVDTGNPDEDTATANMAAVKEVGRLLRDNMKGMFSHIRRQGDDKTGYRVARDELVHAHDDGTLAFPDGQIDGGMASVEWGSLVDDLVDEAFRVLTPHQLDAFLRVVGAGGPAKSGGRSMHKATDVPEGLSRGAFNARYQGAVRRLSQTGVWHQIATELEQR